MTVKTAKSILGFDIKNPFDEVQIKVASPEIIRSWSKGEVKNPETINYRTFKPERGGLFCERIFGPTRDWECNCGKYKRIKHKGIICDRCGVEVTLSKVRRERMGHIELSVPVSHIWFFKTMPSRIGNVLGLSTRALERVLYYEDYIVIDPGDTPLEKKELLCEEAYREAIDKYKRNFVAKMGAEGIKELLKLENLDALAEDLHEKIYKSKSKQAQKKYSKRLKIIEGFRKSGIKPEWMVLDVIPVLPPDLRPLVPLDGGRFATSDLNDLYRRVINRNNRLKNILEMKTPEVIVRNEKRMLQEALDALFDNGRHGRPVVGAGNRPLKSLSDMLKGKQGRFRQNLLGKRVDYSGRSVIVVGPELKLHQCGLPKKMALELFEPFIIKRLKDMGHIHTIKSGKKMIEREAPEVWDILEDVTKDHPIMLNRAPTLHRLGVQAFEPILIEGKAIRLHPLVCTAFNADFDGDQMAVHVPLSTEAQLEARILLLAPNNIFSPSSGKPIVSPTQDITLGLYYLTRDPVNKEDKPRLMSSFEEVMMAHDLGKVNFHTRVKIYVGGKLWDTTVGRVIFNDILPDELEFVNGVIDKKKMSNIVNDCYKKAGHQKTVETLDRLKDLGFASATKAGISIAITDMKIPESKKNIIEKAHAEIKTVEKQRKNGSITDGERHNKIVDIWTHVTDQISEDMYNGLKETDGGKNLNPIYIMVESGARGSRQQIRQLAGMRGLMAKPSGDIIEEPILANFKEGLSVLEYFISTHGARKGLADTALKTADSGYLTRRLVDVAQDVIVLEDDCGTLNGILANAIYEGEDEIVSLKEQIFGRFANEDIVDPGNSGRVIVKAGEEIDNEKADEIVKVNMSQVNIRSVLTCESKVGTCAKCYGRNLSTQRIVRKGEAVGIIAAQSIGEPGTQLTMRTFHIGGTASQIFKQPVIIAKNNGIIKYTDIKTVKIHDGNYIALNKNGIISIQNNEGRELEKYSIIVGAVIKIPSEGKVKKGDEFVEWDPYSVPIITEFAGRIEFVDIIEGQTMKKELDESTGLAGTVIIEHREELHPQILIRGLKDDGEVKGYYSIPAGAHIVVKNKQKVMEGTMLAKTPRKISKTRDITGGLPRVAELFEARRPKDAADIAKIDGVVELEGTVKGRRKVIIRDEVTGDTEEHLVPLGKHLIVFKGDRVKKGEQLTEGPVIPQEILQVCGTKELQEYLVTQVQEVYRLQGVEINNKHIEIIVKQMLRKVKITDSGDTDFLIGEQVDKNNFEKVNAAVKKKKLRPASAEPLLLGITKASLGTESFISAASFQETTRVLTDAAASGKTDVLRGFKEKVIMGNLIPAGTGFRSSQEVEVAKTVEEKEIKILEQV